MRIVARHIFVANYPVTRFLEEVMGYGGMNTSVANNTRTIPDLKFQLSAEQLLIGNGGVVHLIEESEHFRGNILTLEVFRVHILAFIIVRFFARFQHSRSQLCICHTHCFHIGKTSQPTNVNFVLEVVFANVNQAFSRIYIVIAIELGLSAFGFRERSVNVERYCTLLNGYSEVSFDSFQG